MASTVITDPVSGSTFSSDGTTANVQTAEVQNVTGSTQQNTTLTLSGTAWVAFKFNSGLTAASETWATATAWIGASGNGGDTANLKLSIYSDNAGLPGTLIAASSSIAGNSLPTGPASANQIETAVSWSPANSTYYWLVVSFASTPAGAYTVGYDNSTGSGIVATSSNGGSTWATIAGTGHFQLGQGTSHSVVGNTVSGHAVDAMATIGTALYATAQGLGSYAAYLVAAYGANGLVVDSTNTAALAKAVQVLGTRSAEIDLNQDGSISATGSITSSGTTGITASAGPLKGKNLVTAQRTVTSSTSINGTTDGTIWVNGNSLTMTLPSAVLFAGALFRIKNLSGITGTTVAAAVGNVEGGASDTTTLSAALASATYQSDGTNWWSVR